MVLIHTREQGQALRAELDAFLAASEFPPDLTIAPTNADTIVISSTNQRRLRFIDSAGKVRG